MRIWLKIRGFLVMVKFVSACVERDKKILKNFDFCAQLPAFLIDFEPLISLIARIYTDLHGFDILWPDIFNSPRTSFKIHKAEYSPIFFVS